MLYTSGGPRVFFRFSLIAFLNHGVLLLLFLLNMTLGFPKASVAASSILSFILSQLSFISSMSFVCFSFIFSTFVFLLICVHCLRLLNRRQDQAVLK